MQPPRLVTPTLTQRNFPPQLLNSWPRGAPIFMRLRIDAQGGVLQCIRRSRHGDSGHRQPGLRDREGRFRFRPALEQGRAAGCRMGRIRPEATAITASGMPTMIEAEWWEYDSVDELADAVAGDVSFIIESALDARAAALVALPVDQLSQQVFPQACRGEAEVEAGGGDPDRRFDRRGRG